MRLKIPYRVCFGLSVKRDEIGEILFQDPGENLAGAQFTFIVSYVSDEKVPVPGCEIVILDVTGDVAVGTFIDSKGEEFRSGPTAYSHIPYHELRALCAVTECLEVKSFFNFSQEFELWGGLNLSDYSESNAAIFILRIEYSHIGQAEFVPQLVAYPSSCAVKIGVGRIDGDVIPDSLDYYSLYVVSARYLL